MGYIISQIFTIISYAFIASTYHSKKRKTIIILNILTQLSFLVAYSLLGAWSGFAMGIVAIIRNIIFIIDENKNGKREYMNKLDVIILIATSVISIISGIFTYNDIFSVLPVIATIIYTYTVCQKNIKTYKLLGIPIEVLWICYNFYIKSLFGIILEIIMLVICIWGYLVEMKEKKDESIICNNKPNQG